MQSPIVSLRGHATTVNMCEQAGAYKILDAPAIFESAGITDYHYQILLNAGNTTFGTCVLHCCWYLLTIDEVQ